MSDYRSPSNIGDLVHDALAEYYADRSDPLAIIDAKTAELVAEYPEHAEYIEKDAALARIMVEGYLEWLEETGADFELEVVEPERPVEVRLVRLPSGREVMLRGKLDGKVRLRGGWLAFLEHKTVGNFVDLPATAQINRQLLTYGLLEYLEAIEGGDERPRTGGALLNMLRKVKRTARAKPPFYERADVRHNVEELRNHWRHTVAVAKKIAEAEAALDAGASHHDVVPPVDQTDCRYSCPFFQVCPMFDDGSDVEDLLETLYEEHDPFERYGEPA